MTRLLPLLLFVALAACGQKPAETPATAAVDTPAPATAAADVAPAADAPVTDAPATDAPPADAPAAEAPAADAPAAGEPAATADAAVAAPAAPAPPVFDPATSPRPGIDYVVLPTPQPTFGSGGIEVAEVFAYTCIHCANLQPNLSTWKATLPADVRFVYVPGAFGGVSDNFARAFFAAESLGLLEASHDKTFGAHFIDQRFKSGSLEELAGYYATYGSDEATFLSTMNSFAVTSKVTRARQFALRTGVTTTPTIIINGKYAAHVNGDRGPQGLFDTIEFLVAHERAGTAP